MSVNNYATIDIIQIDPLRNTVTVINFNYADVGVVR